MRTSMRILFVLFVFFFLLTLALFLKTNLQFSDIEDNCGQTYEHTLALCGGFF